MNKFVIAAAGAAGAAAIAVPTAIGLAGAPSFNQQVPIRVPSRAGVVSFDDNGHAVERTPSAHLSRTTGPTATPSRTSSGPGDHNGGRRSHTEAGDDNGGRRSHTEAGDDNGGRRSHTQAGDDNGGSDGSGSGGSGSGGGRGGNDDRGGDDSGHHGGDD